MEAKVTNSNKKKESEKMAEEIKVNPLRKERVFVRFVPHESGLAGADKKHVLSGARANGSTTTFSVPILSSTKTYKNVLTNDEKDFLEQALRLEKNALSVYNTTNNFWQSYKVKINTKEGLHLDLSNPEDYIKYKVLLANNDFVAPSVQERIDRPKKSYQFEMVSENNEVDMENVKVDALISGAKELGKSIIVGGSNYGQGSSREHAALAPLYLGIKAVLVKSFARIHRANLINAGILPLTFVNEADYDSISQGDVRQGNPGSLRTHRQNQGHHPRRRPAGLYERESEVR